MIRRPPRSTRTDTLFPDTTLFRSANVSGVMKQRDQHAEHTAMRAESLRSRHAALMSVDQARHRQRTVEAVLGVVVPGVAAGIAGQGDRKSTRLNSSH